MRALTRYHLACPSVVLATLLGLADPAGVDAAADLALEAMLESSRWAGPTHEISAISVQRVVSEAETSRQARRTHF